MGEKFIQDTDREQYTKQLHEFMAKINPKPSKEVLMQLRDQYIMEREAKKKK